MAARTSPASSGVDVGGSALAAAINLGCNGSSLADELDKIGYPLT
jgi:hypothetical protein